MPERKREVTYEEFLDQKKVEEGIKNGSLFRGTFHVAYKGRDFIKSENFEKKLQNSLY